MPRLVLGFRLFYFGRFYYPLIKPRQLMTESLNTSGAKKSKKKEEKRKKPTKTLLLSWSALNIFPVRLTWSLPRNHIVWVALIFLSRGRSKRDCHAALWNWYYWLRTWTFLWFHKHNDHISDLKHAVVLVSVRQQDACESFVILNATEFRGLIFLTNVLIDGGQPRVKNGFLTSLYVDGV